jgi:hypothetical protein
VHSGLDPTDRPAACPDLPERFLPLLDRADRANRKIWEWDRDLEAQGIQLRDSSEPTGLDWQLLARSRDQDQALGLLADLLLRSIPDASTWKKDCGIAWEGVQAFQRSILRPDRAILLLHGDLGLEQAQRLVLLSLGTWTAAPSPTQTLPPALPSPEVQALRTLLALPGATKPRTYDQEDLDRARHAWMARQSLLSLDPEAQMTQVLDETLGRAPLWDRMNSLTLTDLNR